MAETGARDLMATGMHVVEVAAQIATIRELLKTAMVEDKHYGVIPGTEKPSLLQPGAQMLCMKFGIADHDLELVEKELGGDHREYRIHKQAIHRATGMVLCEAYGTCSTKESRYRWRRKAETVADVPKEYWQVPRDDMEGRQDKLVELFGPGRYRVRKVDGEWKVQRVGEEDERVENPDIADTYNTVLSIADKRAYVRMTIKATGASELFTHDIEDFNGDEGGAGGDAGGKAKDPGKGGKTKTDQARAVKAERKAQETERQALIERIALTIAGTETKQYFRDQDRDFYAKEIKMGGSAGGSLPTDQLKKLVEEVVAELARRKALPPEELAKLLAVDGMKDLNKAAEAGWKAAGTAGTAGTGAPQQAAAPEGATQTGGEAPDQKKLDIY